MLTEQGKIGATLCYLIDRADVGVLILEDGWTIQYGNKAAADILGSGPCEGLNLLELIDRGFSSSLASRDLESGSFILSDKETSGASPAHYALTISAVRDQGTDDVRALALLQDIPWPAEQTQRGEEYPVRLSHKLLTPLAAVLASLSLLRNPDLCRAPEDRDEVVSDAEAAAQKLGRAIDHLLALEEPQPKGPAHTPTPQVGQILEMQAASARLKYPNLEPSIEIDVRIGKSDLLLAPGELDTVVENLLDNALKFCDKPRCWVRLQVSPTASSAVLAVEDNGRGIDPADQGHVFDRFFQCGERVAGAHGVGLGLSLVKKIVTSRGGRVFIESVPGEGTTVRVEIPTQPTASPQEFDHAP